MHQVIWGEIGSLTDVRSYANSVGSKQVFSCSPNDSFPSSLYLYLVELENKEIDVVMIALDMGQTDFTYKKLTRRGYFHCIWIL